MTMPRHPLLLCLLLTATGFAQDRIAWIEGTTPTAWTLRELDEQNLAGTGRTVLRDLEILPIEITNRTTQQSLRADRPRLANHSGLPRVELPGGGRLFHYRLRGGERYGYLLITARGSAVVVLEVPGAGAGGRDEPFADRLGVAADGQHAGISTLLGALYAARLDGGIYASTQTPSRPLTFTNFVDPVSVTPGATHLFFATEDDRVWRCAFTDGATPQDLTPAAPAGSILKEEFAPSGDGHHVVFLLGPRNAMRLWLLGDQTAAVQLPPPASDYEEPGYLPEFVNGPRLLLNDDATRLLYTDAASREEIYLLDTTGASSTTHLTSDANLQPYIGIGIMPMFVNATLVAAIGDIGAFDWFSATTQSAAITNLTRTANEAQPPYGAGKLHPFAGGTTAGAIFAAELQADSSFALRRIDAGSGATSIIATALRGAPMLGDALDTAPHVLLPSFAGDQLINGGGTPLLLSIPGLLLAPDVVGSGDTFSVTRVSLGSASVTLFLLPGGGVLPLPPQNDHRQTVLTRGGGLLLNAGTLRYFSPSQSATIATSGNLRVVLSGAGA